MLLGAVDYGPHPFLHREVLGVDALDSGKGAGLLRLTIDHEVVGQIALEFERAWNQILGSTAKLLFGGQHEFAAERNLGVVGVHPVVNRGSVVVERHPDMAIEGGNFLKSTPSPGRDSPAHLLRRHHIVISPNIVARTGLTDPSIGVAVI